MSPEIKKCTDNLLIQGVILKSLYFKFGEEIDEETFDDSFLKNTQEMKFVKSVLVAENAELPEKGYLIKYTSVLGIRFVTDEDLESENQQEIDPLLEVKAEFTSKYLSAEELTEDELKAFGKSHIFYHIWPYWREVIQSTCARAGISPIVIPPHRV
jgi:hypothetical protein